MAEAVLIAAALIVAGGYGLYKIAFARGYSNGYEDATHPVEFKPDDTWGP